MTIFLSSAWIKGLSNLFNNLSATWFAAAFITPSFTNNPNWPIALIAYLIYGILFLVTSNQLQELSET